MDKLNLDSALLEDNQGEIFRLGRNCLRFPPLGPDTRADRGEAQRAARLRRSNMEATTGPEGNESSQTCAVNSRRGCRIFPWQLTDDTMDTALFKQPPQASVRCPKQASGRLQSPATTFEGIAGNGSGSGHVRADTPIEHRNPHYNRFQIGWCTYPVAFDPQPCWFCFYQLKGLRGHPEPEQGAMRTGCAELDAICIFLSHAPPSQSENPSIGWLSNSISEKHVSNFDPPFLDRLRLSELTSPTVDASGKSRGPVAR